MKYLLKYVVSRFNILISTSLPSSGQTSLLLLEANTSETAIAHNLWFYSLVGIYFVCLYRGRKRILPEVIWSKLIKKKKKKRECLQEYFAQITSESDLLFPYSNF